MMLRSGTAQATRRIALVAARGDALVLALCQPRVSRDVPCVCEPSPQSGLDTQNLVDSTRAAINISLIIDGVEFLEQVLQFEVRKFRARIGLVKIDRFEASRVVELFDCLQAGPAHFACAIEQDRQHPAGSFSGGYGGGSRLRRHRKFSDARVADFAPRGSP